MKKKREILFPYGDEMRLKNRKVKLTAILLFIVCVTFGNSFSQVRLTVRFNQTDIRDVIQTIEEKTDYIFLYKDEIFDFSKKVSAEFTDAKFEEVLKTFCDQAEVTYEIRKRQIILKEKEATTLLAEQGQQQKSVSGKVTDSGGEALPGVSVVVKGTTSGTITDTNGNYSLANVPANGTLVFSFVGMKTQEISVSGKSSIDVVMVEDAIGIEEVVAVGYGTMKKSDLTGSITSVSADELAAFPVVGAIQAMQGRASGVQITTKNGEPGAGTRVRIRGGTSLNASSDPLYVVDGFAGGAIPPPEDIASIEILKDASATAIYGSRGANGVILVTTKSGKVGETVIELNTSYSFDKVGEKLDLLNATEFAEYINEVYTNSGNTNIPYPNPESYGEGTDWQDIIFRNGSVQNYKLSASGGKENFKFYTSLNYYDQDGIVINSNYKRYSGLTNLDFDAGKNMKMGTRMFFQRSLRDGVETQEDTGGTSHTGVISGALIMEPTLGIYDGDGDYTLSEIGDPNDNPYATAMEYTNESINDLFQGNAYVDLTILEGLIFKSTFGVKVDNNRSGTYVPVTLNAGRNENGDADISGSKRTSLLSENYLSYNGIINNGHKFSLLAGYSYQSYRNENWRASNNGYITDSYLYWNLGSGANYQRPSSSLTEWEMLSYYGRANYNYKDKYLLTFTGRYDGSSRLGKNNKWAFFPSGAFAWNVKQEPFMEAFDALSHLKFRASYGITGNTDIGIYESLANFASTTAVVGEENVNAVVPSSVANSDLSWESTKQTDVGLDFGLWNGHVIFTADYYYKKTEDLLYDVPLPEYSGYENSLKNIGSVENKGLEFGLNTVNLDRGVYWASDFNISFNRNQVLSLPDGELIYSRIPGHLKGETHILTEGAPTGSFYGYIYDGLNSEGAAIHKDIAGRDEESNLVMEPDGTVNGDDRIIIGNPHPDFIFGINNSLSYKNFDLNIFIQGVVGNDMLNFTRMELESANGKVNQLKTVLDRWTPTNTDTAIPAASSSNSTITSTRWIEDGTYIRLKNVSLGYHVPLSLLKKSGIEKLRLYVSAQNLLTITDYSGYNPDVSYRDSNTSLGLDYGSYPNTKSITFGINLAF